MAVRSKHRKSARVLRVLSESLPLSGSVTLSGPEAHHARDVLRLQTGDRVEVLDGNGQAVEAEVEARKKEFILKPVLPVSIRCAVENEVVPIWVFQTVLKSDAMGFAIEKMVELGVEALTPVLSDFSVVKVREGDKHLSKWQSTADQALKQCGRLTRMMIHEISAFQPKKNDLVAIPGSVETLFVPKDISPDQPIRIWIGPEGGWSPKELTIASEVQCTAVDLGPLILRAETAAITAVSVLSHAIRTAQRKSLDKR